MTPQRCRRHAVCASHKLLIRRPHMQFGANESLFPDGKRGGIQNGQRPVRGAPPSNSRASLIEWNTFHF